MPRSATNILLNMILLPKVHIILTSPAAHVSLLVIHVDGLIVLHFDLATIGFLRQKLILMAP